MGRLRLVFCILLGIIFFVFGLNGFLNFIKLPPLPDPAMQLLGAMIRSGYLFTAIKATEVVCGALLLTGLFVPLALIVLAPITLNIFMFHLFLAPEGLPVPIAIVILHVFLAFLYRAHFASILRARS